MTRYFFLLILLNALGAELTARLVVEGMREQKLGLAKYLVKEPG